VRTEVDVRRHHGVAAAAVADLGQSVRRLASRCGQIVDPVASALESFAGVIQPVVSHEQQIGVVGREREDRNRGIREGDRERGQGPRQVERRVQIELYGPSSGRRRRYGTDRCAGRAGRDE
jgi:hypothetical protein